MTRWVRLAIILSALWLVGLGIFSGLAWNDAYDLRAPYIEYAGTLNNDYHMAVYRFNWILFVGAYCLGGVALIWLLTVGTPWVIQGFRSRPSEKASF
jgi:hypothetical protein